LNLSKNLPLVCVLCLYWVFTILTWAPGLQADDIGLTWLLKDPNDGFSVDWSKVWGDFFSPWMGSANWPYFRPFSTMFHAIWIQIFGLGSSAMGLIAVLFHSINLILLSKILQRIGGSTWSQVLALTFLVLHPILFEPLTWFSASVGVIQLSFFLASVSSLIRALDVPPGGRRRFWTLASHTMLLAALLTKESALPLIPVLLLVQASLDNERSWRSTFRYGLTLTIPVMIAMGLRIHAAGLDPFRSLETAPWTLGGLALQYINKLAVCLNPIYVWLLPPGSHWFRLPLLILVLWPLSMTKAGRIGMILVLLTALTSMFHPVADNMGGSRVLYNAAFASSFALFLGLKGLAQRRALKRSPAESDARSQSPGLAPRVGGISWGSGLLGLWLIGGIVFGLLSSLRLATHRAEALALATRARAELRQKVAALDEGQILAALSFPETYEAFTLHLPNQTFLLVQSQQTGRINPIIGLQCVFSPIYGSLSYHLNATPLRVSREFGVFWLTSIPWGGSAKQTEFLNIIRQKPLIMPSLWVEWTLSAKGDYGPPAHSDLPSTIVDMVRNGPSGLPSVSPENIEALRIQAPVARKPDRLQWLDGSGKVSGSPIQLRFRGEEALVPLTASFAFFAMTLQGGIGGWRLLYKDGSPAAANPRIRVETLTREDPIPLDAKLSGRSMTARTFIQELGVPKPSRQDSQLVLNLLAAGSAFRVKAEKGKWAWTVFLEKELDLLLDLDPRQYLIYYVQEKGTGGRNRRSRPDWIQLHR
jgi:hypothetical protein